MKVLVTKANSEFWYKIEKYNNINELYKMITKRHHAIVIDKNEYTDIEDFDFWEGMKKEDIPIIMNIKLHIEIYNDYRE